MSLAPVRVGVIGAGNNTRRKHLPGLQKIEGVEVVGVCNRSRESSQRVADQFRIPKVYADWREVIADPASNAVVIGTWPYLHCEATCAALEAGKHVLCEARMAMNLAEARRMLQKSREHPGLVTQLVPSPFTLRVGPTMRELIGNGWLGKLHAVTVRGITPEHADRDARLHWRRQRKFSGVNMLTMGIWYEDALRWAGPASRVYAQARICAPRRRYGEGDAVVEVDIPDHVDILAELECGAQATFQFSAVYGPGVGSEVWLFGSEGTLHYDFNADKLLGVRRGEGGYREIEIAPQKAGRWRVAEEFVGAIRGEEEVAFTTFADGVTYMEFSEAVNRSAESGQPVSLPLPA